jgi:hypothetical protein
MIRILLVVLLMLGAAAAHDHGDGSWINTLGLSDPVTRLACCNANDCRELVDGIEETTGGYLIKATGEDIARERVIWRSPGGWWRCQHMEGPLTGKTRCLIGPPLSG